MKNLRFFRFTFLSLLLTFASCNDEIAESTIEDTKVEVSNQIRLSDIPYAESKSLSEYSKDPTVNDYRLARKMALIEIEMEMKSSLNWNGTKLSQKPVVVYDYDSKPKYYEFIVLSADETPVGTVTTFAKKQSDAAVAFTLPYVRDYTPVTTKGVNHKTFVGNYPNKPYYGVLSKSGDTPSALTNSEGNLVSEIPSTDDAEEAIKQINEMTDSDLEAMGLTREIAINDIKTANAQVAEGNVEFWNTVEELEEELLTISDEEITEKVNNSKGFYDSYKEYIIPQFNRSNLIRTRWNGWCGPSALAWLYRGIYSSYNGTYIPLHGERYFEKSGYDGERGRSSNNGTSQYFFMPADEKSYNKSWFTGQSNQIDGGLYGALATYSHIHNNGYKGGTAFYPYLQSAAKNVISGYYLDMQGLVFSNHVSLIKSNNPCIVAVNWLGHYVAAFGVKERHLNWEIVIRIFGWKKRIRTTICKTGEWLYVVDNGNETGNHNYLPFWRYDYLRFNPKFVLRRR